MKKQELAEAIAETTGLSRKKAAEVVTALTDTLTWALTSGRDVRLTGFGQFRVVQRPARQGRNPQTGEPLNVPAHGSVTFRPGKALRDAINTGD
ncbi:HU family DNA-binding protein [Hahella sp. SMD15-11]|uniref:HU family DNA-binding protein n=1 Tax=Thermohahella caldifontis TaxID=3142973 RepID=A0AB39UU10_9GAMM